ncbi:mitochondrial intermediate peptidase [Malassezia brasiliensis]|uniref:mitochondrial intermediate peptidase n=1 Tax=Malassezia brasiliensis TaxID=1821822 RepID=A0AAF0IUU1_9BASI|nr:mitochondrial intermediate peptidase [Malassezia brasiliensis]
MLARHALRPARLPRAPRAARSVATSHEAAMPLDGTQRLGKVKRWRFEPRQMHLARSSAAEAHALAAGVASSVEKDHETLRGLLDRPRLHTPQDTAGLPTGLFGVEALREPRAFMTLAEKTLVRAQLLVHRIARAGAPDAPRAELARVVPNLDRLSDLLCGVIDMAELVRHAHPEPAWAEASNAAYEYLCNFMNILNTHTGLYDSLRRAMADAEIWAHLPEEAQAVATIFLRDFEKSGIHLPPQERERFVALSDEILVLGRAFLQDISARTSDQVTDFPLDLLRSMDAGLVKTLRAQTGFARRSNTLPVVPGSWELHCITKFAPDERARRLAYLITYTGRHGPVDVLERLLRARHELAVLTGKRSFAEMTLVDKMAGTPSNVSDFLHITAEAQRPRAQAMIEALRRLKTPPDAPVYAWDREYLSDAYVQTYHPPDLQPLAPYLSLGSVFTGLSRLFYLLYGIHFRAAPVRPGEVWSPDVLKLEVVDETEGGVIGTIYCDLYARAGKPPSAAHYTVRCSRRIDGDDVENDVRYGDAPDLPRDVDLSNLLDVDGVASPGRPGRFQLPVVVLMTDFQWPSRAQGGVSLLRWQEVETLFHEMGHALHSMIGRTEFHNVSGTRCATDFVELPSILMEHFLVNPEVVQLTAHHHRTGAPLPYDQLAAHLRTQHDLDALDTQHQIVLAQLDQQYHAERAGDPAFSTTAELQRVQATMGLFPPVEDATWQGQFGHLFGYGATYYSYLFDRAIAARVWRQVFAHAPLSRDAGEMFKKEVLQHGGGKNPWTMLATVLRDDQIASGDAHAMQTIGRWGLGHTDAERAP